MSTVFRMVFKTYNDKVLIRKQEVIPTIPDFMIPVDFSQNTKYIINFTTDDMISRFDYFEKNKMNALYLNKIMRKEWLQMLDEFWYKRDTNYSDYSDFWPQCLFKYYYELPSCEATESVYLTRE